MTCEKHLVCHYCKSRVYACKNGRIDSSNDLAKFIEYHEYDCDGKIQVYDEASLDGIFEYFDYYGTGKK